MLETESHTLALRFNLNGNLIKSIQILKTILNPLKNLNPRFYFHLNKYMLVKIIQSYSLQIKEFF